MTDKKSKHSKKKSTKGASATTSKTICTLIWDRSYSMQGIKEASVSGVNEWINQLRGDDRDPDADVRVSISMFDYHQGQMMFENLISMQKLADVKDVEMDQFVPRGGTPLIDAVMTAIMRIRETVGDRKDIKVVIAIQTDGMERDSKTYGWGDLAAEMKRCEEDGFQVTFMGAGIDPYEMGKKMGLSSDKVISYKTDVASTREAFRRTGTATRMFASGASASVAYSAEDKMMSGDLYDRGDVGAKVESAKPLRARSVTAIASPALRGEPFRSRSGITGHD